MTRAARYLSVVFFKTWAELRTETEKTYVGVLWWIVDPILYMAVFYVVFSTWRERSMENFIQFLLVGLVFFRWFTNAVQNGAQSIENARALMQQLYLPKVLFPLVSFAKDSFKFAITLLLLLVFLWSTGFAPSASYLALPVLIAVQIVLTLGAVILAAAMIPVLPDLRFLIMHAMTALLFISGTFYSGADLSPEYQKIFYANPVACLLESYREILLHQRMPRWELLQNAVIAGTIFLALGVTLVTALDRRYPRIVKER